MKRKFKHSINYIAMLTALTSFILGLVCLLLFKTSTDTGLVAIGYFYTLGAALVNSVMLLLVVINGMIRLEDYKEHLKTLLVVLLFIPTTFFYIGLL